MSRIGPIGLILLLSVLLPAPRHAAADRDKALQHYNSGVSLLEEGKYLEAIKELERAVHEDYKFAPAHAKLAAAHFRLNRIEDRRIAAEEYELAIRYDPDNPDYHLELGRVRQVQSFDRAAVESFQKVLQLDPDRSDAYLELGLLHMRRWRMDGDDLRKSLDVLLRAYERGSRNREILFTLGRVANELEEYRIAEEALLKVILEYPTDGEARLQYALALHGQRKLKEAEEAYLTAISMIDPEDRTPYLGIRGVASPSLERQIETADPEEMADLTRRFWRERDPNLGTPFNERQLEHWRRILQADLRFSVPEMGLLGRNTARGQTYVRFGPPDMRGIGIDDTRDGSRPDERGAFGMDETRGDLPLAGDISRHPDSPLHNYGTIDLNPRPVEVWTYVIDGRPFELTFRDRFLDGQYDFAFDLGREVAAEWEAWIREIPQFYLPEYEGKQIQIIADACSFFRNAGTTRQEIYYAVPAKELSFQYFVETWKGRLSRHITVYDSDWNVMGEDQMTVVTEVAGDLQNVRRGSLTQQFDFDLPPGRYVVALSLEDISAGLTAMATVDVIARPLDFPGLRISDIQLAESIAPTEQPNPFDKDGLTVVPHPSRFFRRSKPISFYYEVYGLEMEEGQSRFRVTVGIIPIDVEDAGGIWQAIRRLFRRKPAVAPHISSTFRYTESTPDVRQHLSLDLSPLRYGKYDLSVSVDDLVGGASTSVTTSLWITR